MEKTNIRMFPLPE